MRRHVLRSGERYLAMAFGKTGASVAEEMDALRSASRQRQNRRIKCQAINFQT
jgi:hypothetical protein